MRTKNFRPRRIIVPGGFILRVIMFSIEATEVFTSTPDFVEQRKTDHCWSGKRALFYKTSVPLHPHPNDVRSQRQLSDPL